ncbi:MAG: CPBP family intramembrane metalloprotease [Saprospiraceae bacterium]|nr:CPBP family intramembrane metalloprotease [Saprospiraceae bacterium]MBK9377062.1 CPBP family intramembrane metalloprotease [Saprospiraceae bacterium]MBL0261301.1 CPBP family intramembrane metalloprotease [Saprospiraceae bacterium]MBX7164368.1 CPBP family intramembrane metalloprotease [Saprospiraceae bacterium]
MSDRQFLRQAYSGKNGIFYYLITLALSLGAFFLSSFFVVFPYQSFLEGKKVNLALFTILLPFAMMMVSLLKLTEVIQERSYTTLINTQGAIRWRRIMISFLIWFALNIVSDLLYGLVGGGQYVFQFHLWPFVGLLIVSCTMLFIQSSAEELLFRSYLMQLLYRLFNRGWIALLLSSLCFALLHGSNPEVAAFGTELMLAYYFGFAIFLGSLVLMDEGIELAIGLHAATNLYGSMAVTMDASAIQTGAVYKLSNPDGKVLVIMAFAMMIVYIVLIKFVFRLKIKLF